MRSPELALLDSVTPDEFADAKNAVSEWGSSNFTLDALDCDSAYEIADCKDRKSAKHEKCYAC